MKSIRQKFTVLFVSCALAVSLAGCGVNVTGVSLDLPDSMEKGSTLTAVPEYTFDGTAPEGDALTKELDSLDMSYTSSAPSVVMVDESGNLAALSTGTAEITLSSKDGKIAASKTIEVVVTPSGITTTNELTLAVGESTALETAVEPADASPAVIRYTSSDESIATVSDTGEVTAIAVGNANITASIDGTAFSAICKVTVFPAVESIELNYSALSLQPESTAQLTYTATPKEALAGTAVYASSDEAVATVDANGNITAVADGTAVITVTVNGAAAECAVTVSTKTASAAVNSNNSSSAASGGQAQDSSSAASSNFEYGALPMDPATDGETWWNIDSSDSAYWAVADNINAMRAEGGLAALTVSSSLSSIADDRCVYLIANNIFSHDGATTAEILCSGATSASAACTGWRNSPGHYANIMTASYTQMGIACVFNTAYGVELWCVTFS